MKVIYLINSKEYGYHKTLIPDFTQTVPGEVFDMSDGTDLATRYGQINDTDADVVITFDLAGHILRTGSDTLSLNNLAARMAHILFQRTQMYAEDIKARQNLSMFLYLMNGEDVAGCRARLEEVPNISEFCAIERKAGSEEEHEKNRHSIALWWEEFKKEAML